MDWKTLGEIYREFSPGVCISAPTAVTLYSLMDRLPVPIQRVLEMGPGYSTAVFYTYGCSVVSLEHDPTWAERYREIFQRYEMVVPVLHAPLGGDPPTYQVPPGALMEGAYDLVFIDGPPWEVGRGPCLEVAAPYLQTGAWVLMDDARREGEQAVWEQWCLDFPLIDPQVIQTDRGLAVARWKRGRVS